MMQIQDQDHGEIRYHRPLTEINVTPFVDVMLVLLIVFMVTAPLIALSIEVDLPQAPAPNIQSQVDLVVAVAEDRAIYIGERQIELDRLTAVLEAIRDLRDDLPIRIDADTGLDYGYVYAILQRIQDAGYRTIILRSSWP
ncbi:MAG: biopolymer transporter ExbD [Pseudomonadota bacterium]